MPPSTLTDFVPPVIDASRWSEVEPLVTALLQRPIGSPDDLERWLVDRSELDAACSEARADLYIAMTCRTDDQAAAGAWTTYIEETAPRLKPAAYELDNRQAALCDEFRLDAQRYAVIERETKADVELFRPENVPLETELAKLDQEYDAISGAMTVEFDGKERTLPEMARFGEETDRAVRERAWRAVAERRQIDRDRINGVFDRMIALRDRLAYNAGFSDYVAYAYRAKHRFDYGPAQCEAFHDAIERAVVPLVRSIDADRKAELGVGTLRPWDLGVDIRGRAPLRPFDGGEQLYDRTHRVFERMDPSLGSMFATLGAGGQLDLDSRKGKAPGGYQYMRDRSRKPFIFMNAAGLHGDVRTMVHEAGHAFHSLLCRDEPLLHYRHSPIEFAEVASMTMELLTMPEWDEFYPSEEDAGRARREQLEGVVLLLPWIATIDAFQHWLYRNPEHTRDERTSAWIGLVDRFGRGVSWEGLEDFRACLWQRQGHLFGSPFYYVEYGIAQLGALQLWLMSLEHGRPAAIKAYERALALGGSRPLPELFEAAGIEFNFSAPIVERLVGAVRSALDELPA
ncbi:MAG: M3 family oligoendopeptidase [Phycisphaeraceae bacterium]|nr:M3 family oligoendopeptidase [Phycisphaeraceae bacterium]MCB9848668.1 M3 family oligoendopeptidase [Phycisphaeraceae bacterium]